MLVLGVDPGLTRCGVALVEANPRPQLISYDVIRTGKDDQLGYRLLAIESALEQLIKTCKPGYIAVERVFSEHNLRTVTGIMQAFGVVLLCAARHKIPVNIFTPTEIKAAVSGSGRADKAQVTLMVSKILKLSSAPKPADAADAIAIALTQIFKGVANARYAQALEKQLAGRNDS